MALLERLNDHDLKKYAGQWVAIRGGTVLTAALDPKDVSDWLHEAGEAADLVFRIPAKDEPTNWVY